MAQLHALLDGEARNLAESLGTSGQCYAVVLQELKGAFGRPLEISAAFLRSVTSGPRLAPHDRIALRKFSQQIASCTTWLMRSGHTASIHAPENVAKVTHRLPMHMRNSWYEAVQRMSPAQPNLCDFQKWVHERVQAAFNPFANWINELDATNNRQQGSSPQSAKDTYGRLKVRSNHMTSKQSEQPERTRNVSKQSNQRTCVLCRGNHLLPHCKQFSTMSIAERVNFVKENKLCFNCLRQGHVVKDCKSEYTCRNDGCGKKHHTSIHEQQSNDTPPEATSVSTNRLRSNQRRICLQVLPVQISHAGGQTVDTWAMLDSGSDTTLISEDLASKLSLKGDSRTIEVASVLSKPNLHASKLVSFHLSSKNHSEPVPVSNAFVVPSLKLPTTHVPPENLQGYPHLRGIEIASHKDCDVNILIGADLPELLVALEYRKGASYEPIAIKTLLGWTLLGNIGDHENANCTALTNRLQITNADLHSQVERFWEEDVLSKANCKSPATGEYTQDSYLPTVTSCEDRQALQILKNTICKRDGHYEIGLLWKDPDTVLPDNRNLALRRLQYTLAKLKKEPILAGKYSDVIDKYIENGYARKLSCEEAKERTPRTWYLPHHAVTNPNKPGKIRVVFDAAAKFAGTSLNDQLLSGPDLLNSLVGVLLRFRREPVALMADIESMFHQVKVCKEDQPAIRFLWKPPSATVDTPPDEYCMNVHIFGAKSSACCATYGLRQGAVDQRDLYNKRVSDVVFRNFYCDDFLYSEKSAEDAVQLSRDLIEMLRNAGFRLTKWVSNSNEVLSALPEPELAHDPIDLDLASSTHERALGVQWDTKRDILCFKSNKPTLADTKRGILSKVSSVFDPLGALTFCTITAKRVIQELWRQGIDWDSKIPLEIGRQWQSWEDDLQHLPLLSIPRWYGFREDQSDDVDLHIFCDASEIAYGAVAYLVNTIPAKGRCTFVMSKARLAPLKTLTIPRLELNAAVLATRLKVLILNEIDLNINDTYFWSDSMTTLQYIRNTTSRFSTFVSNRVAEILSHSNPSQWRHVPGKENPADDCSRGKSINAILSESRWFEGPAFLHLSKEEWPSEAAPFCSNDILEYKSSSAQINVSVTKTAPSVIEWSKFSSFSRLQRVAAWCLRYLNNLRSSKQSTLPLESTACKPLSIQELKTAEQKLCSLAQAESIGEEVAAVKRGSQLSSHSKLLPLQPIWSNGLLRVGGRLDRAPVPYESKHQIILPSAHRLSQLLLLHYHVTYAHVGREQTLAYSRQRYWILHGKSLVRQVIHSCIYCKRQRSNPSVPIMADLPKARLAVCSPPFYNTGVDYFGPMTVKIGRRTEKRWGCLFTCMTTRAVHLELAGDLTTDCFIMALRRFICRRGYPSAIFSDNGTNFVGADKELRTSINNLTQAAISHELTAKNIKWHFNPPAAPHFGGVYESLVKSTKRAIKAILSPHNFHQETLQTVLVEVEGILNSRPLTSVSDDPTDYEALTPNHFLLGRSSANLVPGLIDDKEINSRKRWRIVQALSNMFWQRWKREYFPTLSVRHKWNKKQCNLSVNDLVLVINDNAPRSHWPLGCITKVFTSDDGCVRSAEVKTAQSTFTRPVAKLCLLEGAIA